MEINECPKCGTPTRWQAGGISRKGKPYKGFYSCTSRSCDWTYNPPAEPVDTKMTPGTLGAGEKEPVQKIRDSLVKIYEELSLIEENISLVSLEPAEEKQPVEEKHEARVDGEVIDVKDLPF